MELKNARIGARSKVPHLSYLGDADVGQDSNIAAGNITANFPHEPGKPKGRTTIGANVRTGIHNGFVAPVEVGDEAWIAAGSVITKGVPPGALAVARARQENRRAVPVESATTELSLPGLDVTPTVSESKPHHWIERGPRKQAMVFSGRSH